MPGKKSMTVHTLEFMRSHGYISDKTEHWINIPKHPAGGIRRDLYRFIDIVGILPGVEMVGVQCTSDSNMSNRKRKICDESDVAALAALWLSLPNHRILVIGWKLKPKKKGSKVLVYRPRIIEVTIDMLTDERIVLTPNTLFTQTPLVAS